MNPRDEREDEKRERFTLTMVMAARVPWPTLEPLAITVLPKNKMIPSRAAAPTD
ncbi:MAG: hypothetical protein MUD06_09150 [Rhodospirillales bacterium]|jgi:hypothetical protein|nr:hypothetical protein [Rhodospirillales bacterium]